MKKFILIFIPALICGMMFISCDSDKPEPKEDEPISEPTVPIVPTIFQHVETELGGCNIKAASKKREDDVIIITISEDLVNVFVGHNYTCKREPFETEVEIIDDVIFMYLIDICDDPDYCYQRCTCYYTFDFIFQWQGTFNQEYKILLIDPRKEDPVVISEGVIRE
jgi:hypothetical protein